VYVVRPTYWCDTSSLIHRSADYPLPAFRLHRPYFYAPTGLSTCPVYNHPWRSSASRKQHLREHAACTSAAIGRVWRGIKLLWPRLGDGQRLAVAFKKRYFEGVDGGRVACDGCHRWFTSSGNLLNGHLRLDIGISCRVVYLTGFSSSDCGMSDDDMDRQFVLAWLGLGD